MPRGSAMADAIRRRVFLSWGPAIAGGVLGYIFARVTVEPEALASGNSAGLYSAVGAASGILLVRLTILFRMILTDFFKKD